MLTRLEMKNFKCFAHEYIKLKPLTLLTGTNSSGKSSVIQAILWVLALSDDTSFFRLRGLLNDFGYQDYIALVHQNVSGKNIELTLDSSDIEGKESKNSVVMEQGERKQVKSQGSETAVITCFEENLFYLSANRIGAEELADIDVDVKVGYNGSAILGTFEENKNARIAEVLVYPDIPGDLSAQVAHWLGYITNTRIEAQTEAIGSSKVRSYFLVGHSDSDIGMANQKSERSPFNVGAGNSYLLKLIVMCLIAKPDDVLLIENPEIHLHPQAQAGVGEFLAFVASRGVQIIAETHCEHLINQVRYEVRKSRIASDDVIVHYKPSVREDFETIFINESGHYVDKNGQLMKFPSGFFNATLQQLIEIS